jgi:glycerol-3-phosphate O-acyltransferase
VPTVVYEAGKEAGLVNVTRQDYSTLTQPQLHERAQRWILRAYMTMVATALLRSGKAANEETAQKEADKLLKEIERDFAAGVVPDGRIGIVVGQKPE